jgi:predicted amidohydrolase YtcJ
LGHESINVRDAIAAYTINAADVIGSSAGRIELEAPANLILVDKDPFRCSENEIATIKVLARWSKGVLRYKSKDFNISDT